MKREPSVLLLLATPLLVSAAGFPTSHEWQVHRGTVGPGVGQRIVLISGDEEYRSEEALPQLGKILALRHGFECVVLFAQDPAAPGIINPNYTANIPGLEALESADLMIIATRFRDLPDAQMQHLKAYLHAGRPVIGLRTATHAFKFPPDSPWSHWNWNYAGEQSAWHGGFGRLVLGTSWVDHHGWHMKESARGIITDAHAITTGIDSGAIWSPADVYTVTLPLPAGSETVVWGQVLVGTNEADDPIGPGPYEYTPRFAQGDPAFDKNDPMMPLAWTKSYQIPGGRSGRVFASTLGASVDLLNAATRRLLVQGVYWALDLPIPPAGVDAGLIGAYAPEMFGFHREPGYWETRALPAAGSVPSASASPAPGERIALVGNGIAERLLYFPHFETELQHRFPTAALVVRNLGFPGDTPGFRPRSGRPSPWAFPSAEKFHPDLQTHFGQGHYPSPDEWLTTVGADTILAFFGLNESFGGPARLDDFEAELDAFVQHTLAQRYNGRAAPRLILVAPLAFEDLSAHQDLPDGTAENQNLAATTAAMARVAEKHDVGFIDVFHASRERYAAHAAPLTINGISLTAEGCHWLGTRLADAVFSDRGAPAAAATRETIYDAVADKNWYWSNDYGMLNGVHVFGRRHEPYGDENYPEEMEKIRQMTVLRDAAIHRVARGEATSVLVDDTATRELSAIETNFNRPIEFLAVEQALAHFQLPDGYKIDLFASESEFPELRNPVQMSFDNRGRLWVAIAPSYPHYRPGAERPNDKLLIFEDTDGDGRADRMNVFADGLHLPIGFELAPEGVYVSQQPNLVLLIDDNHDDRADRMEILMHGFDTHDTHHSISAFTADASGAIYLNEGRFLHSQVETPYGPQRCTDGGVWRFDPRTWRLERFMQADVDNPWGLAFDAWGQAFLSDASPGQNWWSLPLSARVPHGNEIKKVAEFTTQRVRPTSGSEFVASRHFPEEVQGDFLINNTIGFLGTKQHTVRDDGAGFTGEHRQDLVASSDPNFRPCDLEFGPDGALYLIDWHNPLIGHMQHSARDPKRDRDHGRIYRITYPSRPLVRPAAIAGASIPQLLEILQSPEDRTRFRARRELRGHPAHEVLPAVQQWVTRLDSTDPAFDRHVLEALWATWAQGQVDVDLLRRCLRADRMELRAAAVNVLRYTHRQLPDAAELLRQAAQDPHERVRLSALVAASWLDNAEGVTVALTAMQAPLGHWSGFAAESILVTLRDDIAAAVENESLDPALIVFAREVLSGGIDLALASRKFSATPEVRVTNMAEPVQAAFLRGREVYRRDGHCATCHGEDGRSVMPGVYPALPGSAWIDGDETPLLKIMLKGVWGRIDADGEVPEPSNNVPPMTPFESILSDQEIADVATYVRVAFRDRKILAELTTPERVADVRESIKNKTGFYTPTELLEQHPRDDDETPE